MVWGKLKKKEGPEKNEEGEGVIGEGGVCLFIRMGYWGIL
jgi:hypothetical protein